MAERAQAEAAERADLMARAEALKLEDRYSFDAGTSLKLLRRKVVEAEQDQASDHAAATGPEPPSDGEYDTATAKHDAAAQRLHELQAELAGITSRISDAVDAGQFDELVQLRARQAELPHLVEVAELDEATLDEPLALLEKRRARVSKRLANADVAAKTEAIRKLNAEIWAIQNGAASADCDYHEAGIRHQQTLYRLDELRARMKAPAAH